jgi:hypothetical protein
VAPPPVLLLFGGARGSLLTGAEPRSKGVLYSVATTKVFSETFRPKLGASA